MNCVPLAGAGDVPEPAEAAELEAAAGAGGATAGGEVLLGEAWPKPQPPSRSWAGMMAAHLPVLKPQQVEAQSASLVQGPVMNCVPLAETKMETV